MIARFVLGFPDIFTEAQLIGHDENWQRSVQRGPAQGLYMEREPQLAAVRMRTCLKDWPTNMRAFNRACSNSSQHMLFRHLKFVESFEEVHFRKDSSLRAHCHGYRSLWKVDARLLERFEAFEEAAAVETWTSCKTLRKLGIAIDEVLANSLP